MYTKCKVIGLTNYFRKFVKDYSIKAKPLHELLRKNSKFDFNEECKRVFDRLKNDLITHPVLCLYNPEAETELHTDASSHGIAAILVQKQKTNSWSAVAYFSQATNKA